MTRATRRGSLFLVIDVVLPVLDERAALPVVLASLGEDFRPIVVDNGSTDGSGDLARSLGATVVTEPQRGFGAACWAGLLAAENDIVCFMDCDASFDGASLTTVVAPLTAGTADLVIGARVASVPGAFPLPVRIANRALMHSFARTTGRRFRDLGPMRAAHREGLVELGIRDRRFGWPLEMLARAVVAGWRVVEVDVPYHPRLGKSKVTGTIRGTQRTVRDMRRVMRDVAPAGR